MMTRQVIFPNSLILIVAISCFWLSGCTQNPATGKSQFTALMSPQQENAVGAQEHEKIIKENGLYPDKAVQAMVNQIGAKLTPHTERSDVNYRFFVLDTPIVNAFALPGGYVYVTRGLLAMTNTEDELAAVLAHEIGHVTGKHGAERYSRGVLTTVGATVLSTIFESKEVGQALNLGGSLYLSSYSRGQENEADALSIRYLQRAGYNPGAMSDFLETLLAEKAYQKKTDPTYTEKVDFLATHPATEERIALTQQARNNDGRFPPTQSIQHNAYIKQLKGLIYGDSLKDGFVQKGVFVHPQMQLKFDVPQGYTIKNMPSQVALIAPQSKAIVVFDVAKTKQASPLSYMTQEWISDVGLQDQQNIEINGMAAATAMFRGNVNGQSKLIRLVSIAWKPGVMARFQVAMSDQLTTEELNALKTTTYSFDNMSVKEASSYRAKSLGVFSAKEGSTIEQFAERMDVDNYKAELFSLLNRVESSSDLVAGRLYKVVLD